MSNYLINRVSRSYLRTYRWVRKNVKKDAKSDA
jgi:hypothetical protein